uniref:Putative dual specificity protein kinase spla n=1 Tax=Lutzomyia longipalpis TaxID=7200 RepID=A0A1B0CQV1_LUTLO
MIMSTRMIAEMVIMAKLSIGGNLHVCDMPALSHKSTIHCGTFFSLFFAAKSLPLHCIVESVASLQSSLSTDARGPWKRRSNIEMDSYVIVPAVTQFCNIVNTALQRLGYSPETSQTARGSIVIKNWKPLALEKICDSPLVTVGDVLGELTSVITLRIVILRTKPSTLSEIKDKLLRLLILQSHALLRSSGCPLDEITLSQLCRSNTFQSPFPFSAEAADDIRRKFDSWWSSQLSPQTNPLAHKLLPFVNPPAASLDFSKTAEHLHASHDVMLDNHHQPHHNMIVHPALQTVHSQYPSQKTRMRTSFDPEMELPKLQRWFQENPHPSRQQIQSYVIQLNALESRRGRKPLDVNNVVYWFKNARAAQKRAELRGQSMSNGFSGTSGLMMSQSGYMKSPHSIPSEDIDNLSQHSDDLDDDLDRPPSPQLPLSLTTHERNRSPVSDDRDTSSVKVERDRDSPPPKPQNGASEQTSGDANQTTNHNSTNHTQDSRSDSPKTSPKSEDLDMEDSDVNPMEDFRSPSPDSRRDLPFPMVPNSMFSHSIMYMSHYIPTAMGQNPHHPQQQSLSPSSLTQGGLNLSSLSSDERRKRNRTFIDPVTEVPKLEQWFAMNTHPSHNLILKYTEDLNRMPYRQKFPRLESKNVQFWFKNRRAKCKRLKMSLYDTAQLSSLGSTFQQELEERKMTSLYPHSDRDLN